MNVDCVIPLYNKKNFISKTIESALNQKNTKFKKIIVINDGSTDGGDYIVQELAKKNNSIILKNQKNLGSSAARNNGVKISKAEFVVFLDADDQLHEKYLLCLNLMYSQYSDYKIFSTKHYNVYKNKQLINNFGDFKLLKSKIIKLKDPILNYSFTPKIFCSSGICIEKKLAAKNPFPENINVGEDIYTWLKLFSNNKLIYYDKELIFIFKISENRSVEIFREIPFYLKKIKYLNSNNKLSYLIYFIIASIIFVFQKKNDNDLIKEFYITIKKQSLLIYLILKFVDNNLFYRLYKLLKFRKDEYEKNKKNLFS